MEYRKFVGPAAQRVRVGELLDELETDYRLRRIKSWAQFKSHLLPIREHFGDWRAGDVSAGAVDTYIEERRGAPRGRQGPGHREPGDPAARAGAPTRVGAASDHR